jgi:hypothetical protein
MRAYWWNTPGPRLFNHKPQQFIFLRNFRNLEAIGASGRDALAAGARYRGGVRNWVRPHRTPIHSNDVLGKLRESRAGELRG